MVVGRGGFVGDSPRRMEMFRESSEALLHTVSERGSQLQAKERSRSGGRKYARNGGGK